MAGSHSYVNACYVIHTMPFHLAGRSSITASRMYRQPGGMRATRLLLWASTTPVLRAYDYLPYPPGEGLDAFRPEARTWPGGGVDAYLDAIFLEVRRAIHEWLVIHTMPCHSYHIMFITGSRYYDMWYRHGACLSVFV